MSDKTNCKAMLRLADDEGDNPCTFLCNRKAGHKGLHRESSCSGNVIVLWQESEAIYDPRPKRWQQEA
jgi:hypothetical protein